MSQEGAHRLAVEFSWCSESKEEVTEGFLGADDTLCV